MVTDILLSHIFSILRTQATLIQQFYADGDHLAMFLLLKKCLTKP